MRRNAVGKKIWARTLPEELDNVLTRTCESPAGAAERFPQSAGDNIDSTYDIAIFMCAAPVLAEKTSRVCIINHDQRAIFIS